MAPDLMREEGSTADVSGSSAPGSPGVQASCPNMHLTAESSSGPTSPLARRNSEPELGTLGATSSMMAGAALAPLLRARTELGDKHGVAFPRAASSQSPKAPVPSDHATAPEAALDPKPPGGPLPPPPPPPPAPAPDFWAYVGEELRPAAAAGLPDDVWGQTERDRVYNAILSVPYQLERFQLAGVLVCLDAFLSVFTLVPLRVGLATAPILRASWRRVLYDILLLAMFACMLVFMNGLNVGSIYYWLKDLTHEFLKLSVLYTALELGDKICCSFGVDVLEALAASCTRAAASTSEPARSRAAIRLAADSVVALALLLVHCGVLLGQAMVFSVAMNSRKNALVGLLIAANFGEIKGTVFKRFDATKLYNLTCQDVVERFHLLLLLAFVVVEEMGNSGHASPNPRLLAQCVHIFVAEAGIDVVKHAVLGKFNEIRPGVYREFMRDLSEGVGSTTGTNCHRLVGFEPLASAALFLRLAATFLALRGQGGTTGTLGAAVHHLLLAGLGWLTLVAAKLALGHALRCAGRAYLRHYEETTARGRGGARRNVSFLGPVAGCGVAPPATSKKEE